MSTVHERVGRVAPRADIIRPTWAEIDTSAFVRNVETIARVLKRDGYQTIFLYGGRGVFDGMRSFALNNGYDWFVEQKHFDHPSSGLYSRTSSSPASSRNVPGARRACADAAVPVLRWHRVQWQYPALKGFSVTSKRTPPHMQ